MSPTAKKVLAGLLIFAFGVVVGVFGSRMFLQRAAMRFLHGDPRQMENFIMHRMILDLNLNADQQEKIRRIVAEIGKKLAAIREEQEPQVRAVFEEGAKAIKPLLTPEQLEKFEAMRERFRKRREAMERFGPPPPPPPGMEGHHPPPPPGMEGFPPPPGMEGFPPPSPPGMEGFPPPPPPEMEGLFLPPPPPPAKQGAAPASPETKASPESKASPETKAPPPTRGTPDQ